MQTNMVYNEGANIISEASHGLGLRIATLPKEEAITFLKVPPSPPVSLPIRLTSFLTVLLGVYPFIRHWNHRSQNKYRSRLSANFHDRKCETCLAGGNGTRYSLWDPTDSRNSICLHSDQCLLGFGSKRKMHSQSSCVPHSSILQHLPGFISTGNSNASTMGSLYASEAEVAFGGCIHARWLVSNT